MDIKTLSTIIGHVSSVTTLDIYTHITNEMQKSAAATIDRGIVKGIRRKNSTPRVEEKEDQEKAPFVPKNPSRRRAGTGCISKISETLYEGRYSPTINGKKHGFNIYAPTREECEKLLAEMIVEKKAEIAAMKEKTRNKNKNNGKGDAPIEML